MNEAVKQAIWNKDVNFLAKYHFPTNRAAQNLTPSQIDIIRKIVYVESKRINISAFTRYGKTQIVAIAIALYIILNRDKKIKFIGPTDEQAGLIRDYMGDLVSDSVILSGLADLERGGEDKLNKESSKKRLTFKNGCEYRVITAHGKGFAAMGHGADIIIMDEAAMISREAYTKIQRMLGDDPENAILIELYNPWDRDTKAFDHSISDRFERIAIDYRVGIKEGRTTKEFIDEMRPPEITPLEFEVLYESRFPEQSEDAIFHLGRVRKAPSIGIDFEPGIKKILAKLENISKYTEFQIANINKDLSQFRAVIAADVADKGKDHSVMYWGYKKDNFYQLTGYYTEPKTENMELAGRIISKIKEFGRIIKIDVNIDCIGVGAGVVSRVREWVREHGYKNVKVNACHFGEGATKKDRFMNRKAENYFRLQGLLNENHVKTLDIKELTTQLVAMKWEFSSSGKIKIIDPDGYSPDWSDALVFFVWDDNKGLNFAFG